MWSNAVTPSGGLPEELPKIALVRIESNDYGTFGRLFFHGADRPFCHTLELPWRDNRRGLSCIPAGRYLCQWHRSPAWGWCYHVLDVPGRSHILFHRGNFGGDQTKGLKTSTRGCILLGRRRGRLDGQDVVLVSAPTVRRFFDECQAQRFMFLSIIDD